VVAASCRAVMAALASSTVPDRVRTSYTCTCEEQRFTEEWCVRECDDKPCCVAATGHAATKHRDGARATENSGPSGQDRCEWQVGEGLQHCMCGYSLTGRNETSRDVCAGTYVYSCGCVDAGACRCAHNECRRMCECICVLTRIHQCVSRRGHKDGVGRNSWCDLTVAMWHPKQVDW